MADANDALVKALMAKPVMPEEYDRPEIMGQATPHLEAFGAGLINPARIPSWLANKLIGSPGTDWYHRWSREKQQRSPTAAGMGSAVLPALLAGPLVGGPLLGAGSVAESMAVVPPIIGIGGAIGKGIAAISPPPAQPHEYLLPAQSLPAEQWLVAPRARRPQAADAPRLGY